MSDTEIEATAARMQQILEREYAHLEWRVLVSPAAQDRDRDEPAIFVHTRTRDFRYRCRIGRVWTAVVAAPTLRLLVADVAAEAERCLAQQTATGP